MRSCRKEILYRFFSDPLADFFETVPVRASAKTSSGRRQDGRAKSGSSASHAEGCTFVEVSKGVAREEKIRELDQHGTLLDADLQPR